MTERGSGFKEGLPPRSAEFKPEPGTKLEPETCDKEMRGGFAGMGTWDCGLEKGHKGPHRKKPRRHSYEYAEEELRADLIIGVTDQLVYSEVGSGRLVEIVEKATKIVDSLTEAEARRVVSERLRQYSEGSLLELIEVIKGC